MSTMPSPRAPFEGLYKFPTPFSSPDYGVGVSPLTRIEHTLLMALVALKSKPLWYSKVKDEAIVGKWLSELTASFEVFLRAPVEWTYVGQNIGTDDDRTHAIAEAWAKAVLEDLRVMADQVSCVGEASFAPGPVYGTWVSDNAVSKEVHELLSLHIVPLEQPVDRLTGMPQTPDYHPGSDQQVIDLVHPSLYPLVYGRSLVVPHPEDESILSWKKTIGTGAPIDAPVIDKKKGYFSCPEFKSDRFQWLPSEIDVVARPSPNSPHKALWRSYINNLHPEENAVLYNALERLFAEAFVPLFEKVLGQALTTLPSRQIPSMYDLYDDYVAGDNDEDGAEDNFFENRQPKVPTELTTATALPNPVDISLANTRLQVIVKIAAIELTPDKPRYDGGVWHVEGMENESIAASGIYYWQSTNVRGVRAEGDPTSLSFRLSVHEPEYEQSDDKGVGAVYNLFNEGPLTQTFGSVPTFEGRCLAWPNTHQHRVEPFELADPTQKGSRKIIVFFLVDPSKRVVSTATVPPQQDSWMLKELLSRENNNNKIVAAKRGRGEHLLAQPDLLQEALGFMWPTTFQNAVDLREELMLERKVFVTETMKEVNERPFSLCEH